MMSQKTAQIDDELKICENFSLVLGGPLYQLLCRTHLTDDALTMVRRRILVISLITWLPLLAFSMGEGRLVPGHATVPFLLDLEVHVRFLVAMPLLIGAELIVHQRIRLIVGQFIKRNLVPDDAIPQFNAAMASAMRIRNSVLAEVLLIIFVYIVGVFVIWRHYLALDAVTWYGTPSADGTQLSIAGIWYGYVSLPIFQFLLCRWYFRLGIWAYFLLKVSRIKLNLIPTHPDRNAGLGFLGNTVYALRLIVIAHGALLSGQIANRILYLGAKLPDFKMEIATLVVFLLCVIFCPLLVFSPQLAQAKRTGGLEYGLLAERYVRAFDSKWLHNGGAPADEPLIGSADIQSLADMGNSMEVVRTMRITLITRDAVLQLALAMLLPIGPLVLTMMPLEDVVKMLFGIVF
jgi:hypothetical protein